MAEAAPIEVITLDDSSSESDLNASVLECAVCLQPCVHPAKLPCGHIFCFLCLKGIANQSNKCAMCRQEIPLDYLDKPNLVEQSATVKETAVLEDGYQWFYEGSNGWWQYEERTSAEIEEIYKLNKSKCELMICGSVYVIDFQEKVQFKKHDVAKKRRIKRDVVSAKKKGIAGLR